MKAARFHAHGDPDVLRHEDVSRPEPAPGETLVEAAGTSFNPVDAAIRAGFPQQIPRQAAPDTSAARPRRSPAPDIDLPDPSERRMPSWPTRPTTTPAS